MDFKFEVARNRTSLSKGWANVFCNGQFIGTYLDTFQMGGLHGKQLGGWGSVVPDGDFVRVAMQRQAGKILGTVPKEPTPAEEAEKETGTGEPKKRGRKRKGNA